MPSPSAPHVLDLRETRDEPLLDRLITTLYLPNFAIAEQQEDPSVWVPLLWGPTPPPPRPILHILVATPQPSTRTPLGFVVLEFFRGSRCGLLTYLAVARAHRRRGIGRLLLEQATAVLQRDAARQGTQLQAIFGEVNRAGASGSAREPVAEAVRRLRVLSRLGARRVPVRYVQPALRAGGGRSYSLMLVAFPLGAAPIARISAPTVKSFLHEFYRSLGVDDPDGDPDFRDAVGHLAGGDLPLVPLDGAAEVGTA